MPNDDEDKALTAAFTRDDGKENGPHVAELQFNYIDDLSIWRTHAHKTAMTLGIPVRFKADNTTLWMATLSGDAYSQVTHAMQSKLLESIEKQRLHLQWYLDNWDDVTAEYSIDPNEVEQGPSTSFVKATAVLDPGMNKALNEFDQYMIAQDNEFWPGRN